MTCHEIEDLIKKTTGLRRDREQAASVIGNDPEHYLLLLSCAQEADINLSTKACWILEIVILRAPELLAQHRATWFAVCKKLSSGSAIRPLAKVIAVWMTSLSGQTSAYPEITEEERSQLAELCFTWLLNDHPTAVKVHSMEALYHLGRSIPWIHPELKAILLKDFSKASPGIKARAGKILKKLA